MELCVSILLPCALPIEISTQIQIIIEIKKQK